MAVKGHGAMEPTAQVALAGGLAGVEADSQVQRLVLGLLADPALELEPRAHRLARGPELEQYLSPQVPRSSPRHCAATRRECRTSR